MRILKYILLIPALALAAACNDRPGPEPGGDNLLRIKTGTHAMTATTKPVTAMPQRTIQRGGLPNISCTAGLCSSNGGSFRFFPSSLDSSMNVFF